MATSQILNLFQCCTATLQLVTDQCHFKADVETCRNTWKCSLSESVMSMHGRKCWKKSNIPSTSAAISEESSSITLASMWTVMFKMQPVIYETMWSKSKVLHLHPFHRPLHCVPFRSTHIRRQKREKQADCFVILCNKAQQSCVQASWTGVRMLHGNKWPH